MRVTAVQIRHNDASFSPVLGLDRATRDALATYVRMRWPANTAKSAAREWGLSLDEARGIVAGRTSLATLDRIWKHRNGGWSILLPVMGAVIGQSFDTWLHTQRETLADARRDLEEQDQRLVALAARARALPHLPRPDLARRREHMAEQAADRMGRGPRLDDRSSDD